MYDMKPLEEEWLKYKKKKRKPFYILFSILIFLLLFFFFVFNTNELKLNFFSEYFKSITKITKHKLSVSEPSDKKYLLRNAALTRIEIIDKGGDNELTYFSSNEKVDTTSEDVLVDIPILDEVSENKVSSERDTQQAKVHLDIIESTSLSAYEDVEKRFYHSHDIDDALFLAKSYYKKGNYKKSEKWAFEANKLDSELEESFLIFVKSKMKLGQKNEVISLLNQYLKHNDSKDASNLLKQIEDNKF